MQIEKAGILEKLGVHLEKPGRDRDRDAGLAFVLLLLTVIYVRRDPALLPIPMLFLIICMASPTLFRPIAVLWFGIAGVLGAVMSRIVLTLLFLGLVTPTGLVRRMAGIDSLQRNEWKKGPGSVFKIRDRRITSQDLEKPY